MATPAGNPHPDRASTSSATGKPCAAAWHGLSAWASERTACELVASDPPGTDRPHHVAHAPTPRNGWPIGCPKQSSGLHLVQALPGPGVSWQLGELASDPTTSTATGPTW